VNPVVNLSRSAARVGFVLAWCAWLGGVGCRSGIPISDRTAPPAHSRGTISGTVHGPDRGAPARRRDIRAIDATTGRRYNTRANDVGDYTFLLPPGRYRIEASLRRGEVVAQQPDTISLAAGDIKADVDIVLARAGGS
jgi:hypothetical protein